MKHPVIIQAHDYPMMRNAKVRNAYPGNPFRYGTVVDDPYFINRVKELAEVRQSLLSGQNLIIYSPRLYGKTSLIKKVLKGSDACIGFMGSHRR